MMDQPKRALMLLSLCGSQWFIPSAGSIFLSASDAFSINPLSFHSKNRLKLSFITFRAKLKLCQDAQI
jgi:hypothetical protein